MRAMVLLLLAGCSSSDVLTVEKSESDEKGDAYAMVTDLDHTFGAPNLAAGLNGLRRRWDGRPVRWEGGFVAPYCTSASFCSVTPFDSARLDGATEHGFMVRLDLDEAGHDALTSACDGIARCVVRYEGILDLRASVEEPTAIAIERASFLSAREALPGERWFGTGARAQR